MSQATFPAVDYVDNAKSDVLTPDEAMAAIGRLLNYVCGIRFLRVEGPDPVECSSLLSKEGQQKLGDLLPKLEKAGLITRSGEETRLNSSALRKIADRKVNYARKALEILRKELGTTPQIRNALKTGETIIFGGEVAEVLTSGGVIEKQLIDYGFAKNVEGFTQLEIAKIQLEASRQPGDNPDGTTPGGRAESAARALSMSL